MGNTRTCSKTASVYVDKEAPDCSWSGEGYNWTNGNRIITVKGVDVNNGSGSSSTNSWSYTSGTTGTANLSYAISDSAGNTRTCSKTASVYVDKEAPNCSWGGEGYSWTNSSRTITLTGVDVNSGSGSSSSYSWPYTSGTTSTASLSGEVSDAVGNKKNCSKSASVYVDKEPPTKPTRGAIGGVSGSNSTGSVQIPAGGSTDRGVGNITYQYIIKNNVTDPSKNDSGFSSSMSFRRSCGTSYYAWAIAVDGLGNRSDPYYLGSTADGANHYNAWGACSKDCDGGVQYRTNNCALITSSLSQSCNTQKCTNCNYYFGGFTHTYSSQSTPRPSMRHNVATNVNITDCNTLSFTVTANLRPTGNNGVWCTCGGGSFCHCDVYYTIHIGSTSYDIYLTRRWNRQGHYGEDYTEYAYGGLLAYGNRYNLFNDDYLYDNYYNNVARNITLNVSSLTGNVDIYTEFGGDSNSWWGSNSFTFSGFTLKD